LHISVKYFLNFEIQDNESGVLMINLSNPGQIIASNLTRWGQLEIAPVQFYSGTPSPGHKAFAKTGPRTDQFSTLKLA
jgi:hypothetical protein